MKRKELVGKLIKEGFSLKTLSTLSDKELTVLGNRILSEQTYPTVPAPNPGHVAPVTNVSRTDIPTQNALKQQKKPFTTYESEMSEEKERKDSLMSRLKRKIEICKDKKKKGYLQDLLNKLGEDEELSLNEWVNKIVSKNVHTFTSKNEILEMVQTKLKEQEVMEPQKKKSKLPDFLSFDQLKSIENGVSADTEVAPAKPKVVPGTRPTTDPGKPKWDNPYKPGPGKNPKPKAKYE